ncbi:uncharacterized protein LOC126266209 [Aethina tumida]|uniref:uncharacterized protein LOC126266209 n=1 Tax=Aethina tumida TaxID=116153 RepID=UPI002148A508|nr:uncharacterized protein LOC126266209 [Aethina tumida]
MMVSVFFQIMSYTTAFTFLFSVVKLIAPEKPNASVFWFIVITLVYTKVYLIYMNSVVKKFLLAQIRAAKALDEELSCWDAYLPSFYTYVLTFIYGLTIFLNLIIFIKFKF